MKRLHVIVGQVVASQTGSGGTLLGPEPCAEQAPFKRPSFTDKQIFEIKKEAGSKLSQIGVEQMRLKTEGIMPTITSFDAGLLTGHNGGPPTRREIEGLIAYGAMKGGLEVLDLLPGPWRAAKTHQEKVDAVLEVMVAENQGNTHQTYVKWQMQYGDRGLASNIIVPQATQHGFADTSQFKFQPRAIIADPEDAHRISRTHVRKEGNFEPVLADSVIATTDNEYWKAQRAHLAEAFLPLSSLAKILPKSLERAKHCADRMATILESGSETVDMSDFFLHETQAQLQLALLGMPEEIMEATNAGVRGVFLGDPRKGIPGEVGRCMQELEKVCKTSTELALPSDGCPVNGPLSRAVQNGGLSAMTNFGNLLLILFAGHDTTGHTMTWLLFELCRHPDLLREVQKEVDGFFKDLDGRDPTYTDLSKLQFMDRCITETLRMWPAVANGTFRQLQFDEFVKGPGGEQVKLPKGTGVQIINWSRHRNPDLWGADADHFNPRRHFEHQEVAHVGCPMAAVSPQSDRFSPFAHNPRSCLGRNFAQMEMRLIILHLLRCFTFSLAPPHDALMTTKLGPLPREGEWHALNRVTLGPMNPAKSSMHSWGERFTNGMQMYATARV
mmetsp:Transcript_39031/g.84967  ORF Transcript_39031/g.84967 Transcript_39031/m.84967 type:complete len:613 (-) Transcript_39031:24-1862(-)